MQELKGLDRGTLNPVRKVGEGGAPAQPCVGPRVQGPRKAISETALGAAGESLTSTRASYSLVGRNPAETGQVTRHSSRHCVLQLWREELCRWRPLGANTLPCDCSALSGGEVQLRRGAAASKGRMGVGGQQGKLAFDCKPKV